MKFMEMCFKNGFFTCGDNKQYSEVLRYYYHATLKSRVPKSMIEAIVYMTYICSDLDEIRIEDVRKAVYELFADKEIYGLF